MSVNEQLVAAGNAVTNPSIDRGRDAAPVEEQVASIRTRVPAQVEPYLDGLVAAETAAWEGRVGALAKCRTDREDQDRRHDDLLVKMYGPDMIKDTDDDPAPAYGTPGSGGGSVNLPGDGHVNLPKIGGGGGHRGGRGWF